MLVMKFGGTSVRNAEYIDKALDLAEQQISGGVLLVSSAMSGVTNSLITIASEAEQGNAAHALELYQEIKTRHLNTAEEFLNGSNLTECLATLDRRFERLESLAKGLSLLKECSLRSRDALMATGELLSTTLIYHRALQRGMDAVFLDSRDYVITDDNFSSAFPLYEHTNPRIQKAVEDREHRIYIAQGFIGSTLDGITTTLGRSGSDFSATIYGAAIKATEVQIWTDVNGIMTTDPRLSPAARTVEKISYDEAAELAYFGAKVVHPSTIRPAVLADIPVSVRNTADAKGSCTTISNSTDIHGLRAIAGKKNITLLNICSSNMLNAYGFLSAIFRVFEEHRTPVDLIATSEVSVSMTIEDTEALEAIVRDLAVLGDVKVETDKAIICLVGLNLWRDSQFTSRVFSMLKGVPIRMISLGSSDINLSIVVPQDMMDPTIVQLHDELLAQ